MSVHHRHLPDLDQLQEIRKECSSNAEFVKRVLGRADAWSGSNESMEYLGKAYDEVCMPDSKPWDDVFAAWSGTADQLSVESLQSFLRQRFHAPASR
jgi:hypothetical protein